jgi:CheY-like chemotaxis protein
MTTSKGSGFAGWLLRVLSGRSSDLDNTSDLDGVSDLDNTSDLDNANSEKVRSSSLGPSSGGMRVLLAEDSMVNQKLAVALLEKGGHAVVVAENGEIAVDLAARQQFDVVLMDVQMPVMDGIDATKAIREHEKTSGNRIPIIALTAHAMAGDRERCLQAGMDKHMSKPLELKELHARLNEIVEAKT